MQLVNDNPDGHNMAVANQRRPSVLQGESGDAVGGGHRADVTMPVRVWAM